MLLRIYCFSEYLKKGKSIRHLLRFTPLGGEFSLSPRSDKCLSWTVIITSLPLVRSFTTTTPPPPHGEESKTPTARQVETTPHA